jgi:hypothetical protein
MSYGHVYIVQAEDHDLFKIGKTSTTVEERIKALQTGCPYKLRLYQAIPTYFPERLEKLLHKIFREERHGGEWFAITSTMIDNVLSAPAMDPNPWTLEGDPMDGVAITPTSWTKNKEGRVFLSSRCICRSELEAEVYRLAMGLFQLLDGFSSPWDGRPTGELRNGQP